jgi:hypothetical protein
MNLVTPKFRIFSVLLSRSLFFVIFQTIIAISLNSWQNSEKYWMLVATLSNIVSIIILVQLFKSEGKKYLDLFRFNKSLWKKDLSLFIVLALLMIPIAIVPNYFLSKWFWSDPGYPVSILFQALPAFLMYFLLIAFPITITLAELATYFGYILPRLEKVVQNKWLAVLLPVIFLSLQHCFLPLVLDLRFILYRGLMYFPFALFLGISLWKRPGLLPYFVILHGLMDMQAVVLLIVQTNN